MLKIQNISFDYGKHPILDQVSFNVKQGDYTAVIGESGSGKTTLLKLIYGYFDLIEGDIFWGDIAILGPKYNLVVGYDFMKYVAQEFDLMPYISVAENVGKFLSNFYPEEKRQRINELLKVVQLENVADIKVQFLSGGQKQRVALAQAMAKQPEVLLLDEPFSHIDNFKKQSLRRNLFSYLKSQNITCVVASHDKDDVLGFADQIIVLDQGKIIAQDSPKALYKHPNNPLIASFFGDYSVLKKSEILEGTTDENEVIVYAHQLEVVDKSHFKVNVIQSYFNGSYYLIKAHFNGKDVFFNSSVQFEEEAAVYLKYLDNS
ncbi:MAG: ABC transporter ATP-binding protein [Flavobacteriaceae bacterium]|nr:ABC transporter ATP-binding protein [Flavobacteriaceae bacterium]NNK61550.1 ABC transporter ATP-binding protein [Flavobacteriaceae bacterium]